jgi:signal transduction histidine kinase
LCRACTRICVALPRLYTHLVALMARREDDVVLFDPVTVWPDAEAGLLLVGLCLLTGALFLCVHAAYWWARHCHRLLAPLPYVAVCLGLLPWAGAWLAACAALVSLSLRRGGTRPERAMAVTFLAAIASFPLVYLAERDVFVRDVAARARDLINRKPGHEALLARAVKTMTDPGRGVARRVAQDLAVGRGLRHLAFRLWSAADWEPTEPCAVQVWDRDGRLVSAFDFDSPPSKWLPAAPRTDEAGAHKLFGRGGGEALQFYAHDLELRTIGDQRLVGLARIVVPDQWDVLLYSTLRPSLFREPLDLRVRAPTPPVLLAELDPTGTPRRSSSGTTAELDPPSSELLQRARRQSHASARVRFRGRDARLILVAATRYKFAALVFKEAPFQRGAFVFAKMLLTYAAVCLAYALAILILRRGRVTLLFRHRVALVLVLLSVPPLLLLAAHNRRVARELHQERIDQRLRRRLDLAETLLRERREPVDNAWCVALAAKHFVDINVYRGQDLVATSRPGLWDTGLLGRRLAARPFAALVLEDRDDYAGREYSGHTASLRVVFRKVSLGWPSNPSEPILLSAPALENRRALERKATEGDALLLAIFLTTATLTVFLALVLARSLTRPVLRLREATSRVAAGELDARLPEGRADEFGDLIRAFNRMTRELREAQDLRVRAEKARAWQEMARQVAHEIKNPLTPIKLTIQNLLAAHQEDPEVFNEEFENGAKLILDQIAALHRIAGAFSAYANFPSRHPRQIDVNAMMADVAALYGAAGGSVVEVQPAPEPLVVQADYDELRRALINLVTNARQARAGRVTLSAAPEDGYARLDVVDDGAGIPAEVQARLFDPSFTTKTSGTGLGLPIVKRIVDDCGGAIEIDSPPNGGTRITIRLPMV